MDKKAVSVDMINSNAGHSLLVFVIPMIIGNIFQQFYNMTDSAVVGHFVGEEALAAVGASYAVTNIFIALANGAGIGCSVIISQYFGARDFKRMKSAVSTALLTIFAMSVVLAVAGAVVNERILYFINTPENVFKGACDYLRIYFYGLPFLFMYNVLSSVFNSIGDSRTPLLLLIFSSVLNIFLDIVFVAKFGFGIKGVAYATLIAQGISAVISFIILLKRICFYKSENYNKYDATLLKTMSVVAFPTMLQQSIVSVGSLLVQSVINGFGTSVLAGYTAATRVHFICIVPVLALGNATATFTAQNIGAGKTERVSLGYRAGIKIMGVIYVFVWILLMVFSKDVVSVFLGDTSSKAAYETGISYLRFISFFYFIFGLKSITDGVLKGSGDMKIFTGANLINLSIRVVFSYVFAPFIGACAVWYAMPIGWFVNFAIDFIRYINGKWKTNRFID
ncbi:MAG: MATE family efflux transporter [Clostridia bacterium]|jgi:putative MATE family efflux protein|nr:MATE family efflux transporter [Clostridia bacterium]